MNESRNGLFQLDKKKTDTERERERSTRDPGLISYTMINIWHFQLVVSSEA